ncbi:MAG: alpha-galactosidase [Bryobacteraceae bacterium]|nr:alpha-galactosidase [Bryobacteraceae bacterium]
MSHNRNNLTHSSRPGAVHVEMERRQFLLSATGWGATKLIGMGGMVAVARAASGTANVDFDPAFQSWTLQNDVFRAVLRLNQSTGQLQLEELRDLSNNDFWRLPSLAGSFPIDVELDDGTRLSVESRFLLTGQSTTAIDRNGRALTLELSEEGSPLKLTVEFQIFPGQPVLRHQVTITNRLGVTVNVRKANFLAWQFADEGQKFTAYAVHQWVLVPREANFDPVETPLVAGAPAWSVTTGSGGAYCAWLAVRDSQQRGLFAGLEFNGRADFSVRQANGRITLGAEVKSLYHPLRPGEAMVLPAAMIGLFRGDWDEAGYRTQRYVEAAVAAVVPDNNFPYVAWDSWGYLEEINEDVLRRNARIAANLGMELFIVDLGWANALGDWTPDPDKFPNGFRALSDFVHDLGMKFGLHFAFSEADPDSPVLQSNPDWTSSETYNFHGGLSLCLGHQPCRDWIIEQGVNLVRNYRVDWILQDGQTLVKQCTKTTHTHHPENSNWANSEQGLDVIVSEIRRRTGVLWENCANGGSMMTYKMARNYVTSITNDASGSLGSRQGAYGATFPFPPRFSDRYMPDQDLNVYTTRSFMFGGPWIFMNRLPELTPADLALALREIGIYKSIRTNVRDGRVSHLTARPALGQVDALQSYTASGDTALAVVTREEARSNSYTLRFRDLTPTRSYLVRFETSPARFILTGAQLMNVGVVVPLPDQQSAEIVYVEPAP